MTKLLCQSTRCRGEARGGPRQVEPTRPLCRICAENVQSDLAQLAQTWPDLQVSLSVEHGFNERVSGSTVPGLMINEDVSHCMHDVIDWVWFLIRVIVDETSNVRLPRDHDMPVLLSWLARWHSRRLTYHTDHGLAAAIAEDAADYKDRAWRAAYARPAKRVQIPGQCLAMNEGQSCGGVLYAIVREDDSLLPSEIICDKNDEHRIPAHQWATYGKQIKSRMAKLPAGLT